MKIKTKYKTEWRNKQGQLHRTDGPATIYENGYQLHYLNGNKLTKYQF